MAVVTGVPANALPPMPSLTVEKESKNGAASNAMAGIAVVDMNRLYNASGAPKEYDRKFAEVTDDAQRRLKLISDVSQLNPNELQEFVTLAGGVAPTEADQKRLKELQALSDQRVADYRVLQGKTGATPAENSQMRAFSEQDRLFHDQLLPNIRDGFRQYLTNRMEEFRASQMAQIRAVVGQVAKQKGVTHVFDSAVLVYCENDLTAAVLQKLNKKK